MSEAAEIQIKKINDELAKKLILIQEQKIIDEQKMMESMNVCNFSI